MKEKTIKSVLSRKFEHWIKHIDDEEVRKMVRENSIITGGSIVSMLLNEKINDFDIYFRNIETVKAIAEYYVNKMKESPNTRFSNSVAVDSMKVIEHGDRIKIRIDSAGTTLGYDSDSKEGLQPDMEKMDNLSDELDDKSGNVEDLDSDEEEKKSEQELEKYSPIFISSNCITLSGKVQVIVRFYGDPDEIHKNYDFEHCKNYWTSWDNNLVLKKESLICIMTKELKYTGSKYPICSVFRTRKFLDRGWTVNAGQYVKMALQIADLDLGDVNVLEDQLIGVDTYHFMELIKLVRENTEKNGGKIDRSHIVKLIDSIF